METMLIIGIVAVALLILRPAPRTQVICVPLVADEVRGGLGCLPLVVVVALALLVLVGMQG
jgi:hypothetical protein